MMCGTFAAFWRRRSPGSFLRPLLVLCLAALLRGTAHARPAGAAAWGVHVCARSHYDPTHLLCRKNDTALSTSAFASAQLSISGRSGGSFTSDTLTVTLGMRTQSGVTAMGSTILSVGTGDTARSLPLVDAFISFGVEPLANRIYVATATERAGTRDIPLGSAVFSLLPSSISPDLVPPSGNPSLVVIKLYGAALRAYRSSDAPIQSILPCGAKV
ncbi:MAG: hypothetical protein ACRDGS_09300, partial [Chloroflexota bacterium]